LIETSFTAQVFLALGLLLIIAKLAGDLSVRLGQPSMLGALIAGVLLGPGVINFYQLPVFSAEVGSAVATFAELGFLLLVFHAGLELTFSDLGRLGRVVFFTGWLGVIVTLLLIIPAMLALGFPFGVAAFVGVALAGTGNGVAAQMVLEMGMARMKVGIALLGAAMVDDVLVLLSLSALVAITAAGAVLPGDMLLIIGRMLLFVAGSLAIGWLALPHLAEWAAGERFTFGTGTSVGVIALAVAVVLVYGWAAEAIGGMTPIAGAFIAGLCFGRAHEGTRKAIEDGVFTLNYALLVPIFFVQLGIRTDIRLIDDIRFIVVLLVLATLTKLVGCWLGARAGGFDNGEALHLAIAMIPRGAVGLAITGVGLRYGLMPEGLFPELVVVILGTTLIAPPVVRWLNLRLTEREAVA
jgi:Kef-type K+ transport system membrane component KefB